MKNCTKNLLATEFLTLHGVFLVICQKGVLLQGPSGCGKSECALALLDRKHQLICDDAPLFVRKGPQIIGSCPPKIQNLLEVRGLGIIDVQQFFGLDSTQKSKDLELIIELIPPSDQASLERPLEMKLTNKNILDVDIPLLRLPVNFSRNMAILIEIAVRLVFADQSTLLKELLQVETTE